MNTYDQIQAAISKISNSYIRNQISSQLNTVLTELLTIAKIHDLQFFIIEGHTPSFNDGDPCTHSQSQAVDVYNLFEISIFDRIQDIDPIKEDWDDLVFDFSTVVPSLKDRVLDKIPLRANETTPGIEVTKKFRSWNNSPYWETVPRSPHNTTTMQVKEQLSRALADLNYAFQVVYDTNFVLFMYLDTEGELVIVKEDIGPRY